MFCSLYIFCNVDSDIEQCPGHNSLFCKKKRIETICKALQLRGEALPSKCQDAIDV